MTYYPNHMIFQVQTNLAQITIQENPSRYSIMSECLSLVVIQILTT